MPRHVLLLLLLAAASLASACGGGGGSSSASVPNGAVAVVGDREVTLKSQNHQVHVRLNQLKAQQQTPPKAGSDAYRQQVIQPAVSLLVFQAQVKNIAQELGISVTPKDVTTNLNQQIQQFYGGDHAKYQQALERAGTTDADVRAQIEENLLERKIQDKLLGEVKVTDQDIQKYYENNKSQYATPDSRSVQYILMPSQKQAAKARAEIGRGVSWKAAAKGSIDTSAKQPNGTFEAQKGGLEQNFEKAAFSLPTGTLSPLVKVSKSYADSTLPGRCKPDCYFVIRPTAAVKKGGQKSLDEVKDQIRAQLEQTQKQQHFEGRIRALLSEQKKQTHYAQAFKPPPAPSTKPATSPTT